jgi:hypothetical protein
VSAKAIADGKYFDNVNLSFDGYQRILFLSSPPASAGWIFSAGAGSGRQRWSETSKSKSSRHCTTQTRWFSISLKHSSGDALGDDPIDAAKASGRTWEGRRLNHKIICYGSAGRLILKVRKVVVVLTPLLAFAPAEPGRAVNITMITKVHISSPHASAYSPTLAASAR